jgi:phenylacetate-CoA ligase
MTQSLTDQERYPTLSEHGRALLDRLREHPAAPIFRNQSGNRLTEGDLARVRQFERDVEATRVRVEAGTPSWLSEFLEHTFRTVPHYRKQGSAPSSLEHVASVSRADFARDIAAFVPDDAPVERLINFRTSGTTGHPLLLASHPVVAAGYLPFHKRAFHRFGVELSSRRGQVGVILLGFQKHCFTYVSVTPTMDECGLAKINLHPNDWRDVAHRARYLEAMDPEVIAGDPISFTELLRIAPRVRPKILLSTSMSLSAGLLRLLGERVGCPVADIYSLNEAGPVAVYDPAAQGHVLLQHRMLVEILDPDDRALPEGQRGEVTLTGGFNFCLPLVRYRTGDFARLGRHGDEPVLRGLEGRAPVRFETTNGGIINNVDVTHALADLAIAQYTLHQRADASLELRLSGFHGAVQDVRARLLGLFGDDQRLDVHSEQGFQDKVMQYTSARAQPEQP